MENDVLIQNIEKSIQLSKSELEQLCSYFKPKVIQKKEFLLTQGSVCKFEGFVLDGCFRVFVLEN
ncbi:cyclic nucleotide-binding domain-containing protein [Pseudotamlana agarivorans]|uniref:hypothetical protein n=1 Tax=Pseudotamlana agarivorans TaxID=481183 RepID=UPI00082E205A|nr:hypothetical protein [Tamlana agarivorans]